ncbi:PPK2 family polyphosphate kinase [Nocardia camponoti]|uniref:Polyphosphate kinase-2-related domain-containing protein n=1 Tax=Nocardia camponoti TaxID=1616106 RepID=A0A917QHT7_9NOCA|nr:PPK2 family polyphosphate kinase [Nocardia camponoti]GGK51024.1 hypothetical protein GCM10011591_23240 [Nocardia camponoti]
MTADRWTEPAITALNATGVRVDAMNRSSTPGFPGDKHHGEKALHDIEPELATLQLQLYANGRAGGKDSLLLILQGTDCSGKSSLVRHVFRGLDPQGLEYHAFRVPTPIERDHNYLWRIQKALPLPGKLSIFDRSQYEDIIVPRVHNTLPKEIWERRYDEINSFERMVTDAGTTIVKLMLFISPEEQAKRQRARLENPAKYWKFDPYDVTQHAYWDQFQEAYQSVLDRTNTDYAPWYAIPADHKWYTRLAAAEILIAHLRKLDLGWPPAEFNVEEQLHRLDDAVIHSKGNAGDNPS